jgi:NO-binding membrane sensor protein with MHYT domain
MESLEFGHNAGLVIFSLIVALVAGFTGLSLTRDLSSKSIVQRKVAVALASVALGGGIWSMHFVAMLGLQLPILFYYDAAITLASALIAVLVVAVALALLHFVERSTQTIVAAGVITGIGILLMHYIGMAGLQFCRAIYTPFGVILSSVAAIALCVLAFYVAYNQRNDRNILLGTLCFGIAVFAVHFAAMTGTGFIAVDQTNEFGPLMSNETLAIGVILSSFVIFGTFLWVGATFLAPSSPTAETSTEVVLPEPVAPPPEIATIPCERDGKRVFVRAEDVSFIRADGHYTQVYTDEDRLFCIWPITEAANRLIDRGFVQVHRSYMVNPAKIAKFERTKDKGSITFAAQGLPLAPVSRSKIKDVQALLAT